MLAEKSLMLFKIISKHLSVRKFHRASDYVKKK